MLCSSIMTNMLLLDQTAETRIREAMERGEFDNLPGQGQSLSLDDDRRVPESLRAAYRILKNAGYLPPEMEIRREIRNIEQLLIITEDETERRQARKRLDYLLTTLETASERSRNLQIEQHYYKKLIQRLGQKQE